MWYAGEDKVLNAISDKGEYSLQELSNKSGIGVDNLRRILESLKTKEMIDLKKKSQEIYKKTKEFEEYVKNGALPEYSIYLKAKKGIAIDDLEANEKRIGLPWALRKGFVIIEGKKLKVVRDGEKDNKNILSIDSLDKTDPKTKQDLLKRGFFEKKESSEIIVIITDKGTDALKKGLPKPTFNVEVETADARIGKSHPLTRAIVKMRRIFLEMGFEEMRGDIVESSFWNFDALFQPQDHPARELADTFYLEGKEKLPDLKLVERVKRSHEKGWKYKWEKKEAERAVLRTHTTAVSARYLENLKEPKKYFSIGRVFRNEATDFKHLAEFHQVEGIVCWEKATFTDLLGVLKIFYKKLGFEKIRFRPSYFPYTEPSLEIEVYYEPRKQWMEMGGAGIFRPEMTKPLTDIYPVLAWGLSLERPLMMMLELEDIRTFYKNDIEWLRKSRIGNYEY